MTWPADRPEIVERLVTQWDDYAARNGVVMSDVVSGY